MPSDWSLWSSSTSSGYYSTEGLIRQAVWSFFIDSVEEMLEEDEPKEKELGFFKE